MLVNSTFKPDTKSTYDEIDAMSADGYVTVQYPDGALWAVEHKRWRKLNNA